MASTIQVDNIKDIGGNTMISSNGTGTFTNSLPAPTSGIVASAIDSGTIATARLGSGTASSSTFLRGDQTYAAAGGGLTQSSTWYVTTAYKPSAGSEAITNWAESDAGNYNRLGTSPTQSSGVFSLPATGWWEVSVNLMCYQDTAAGDTWGLTIETSTNSGVAYGYAGAMINRFDAAGAPNNYRQVTLTMILKCENTSTFRFRAWLNAVNESYFTVSGGTQASSYGGTYMNIMKLAEV